jgi:type IV pilus assembly protein PilA
MKTPRGFTLVEMMIVLGIIAALALMLVPAYNDRFVREQVAEALPLADVAKSPIAAAWLATQTFPADNAAAGLPAADKIVSNLVSSVSVEAGAIHIKFGNRANNAIKGKVLTVRPAVVQDAPIVPITWLCGQAGAPEKMTAKGANRTDLPLGYLPARCR